MDKADRKKIEFMTNSFKILHPDIRRAPGEGDLFQTAYGKNRDSDHYY